MKATIRRTIEMGNRVLSFSQAHPDPSPGYAAALARLEKSLAEADVLAARQREGINAVRSATAQKRALRRKMRRTQLVHLARVAESAAAELPDIAQKFRLSREGVPYLAFRTAARGMSAEAESEGGPGPARTPRFGSPEPVPIPGPVRPGGRAGDRRQASPRRGKRRARWAGRRADPDRPADGWAQPVPLRRGPELAGRVAERQQRGGSTAGQRDSGTAGQSRCPTYNASKRWRDQAGGVMMSLSAVVCTQSRRRYSTSAAASLGL